MKFCPSRISPPITHLTAYRPKWQKRWSQTKQSPLSFLPRRRLPANLSSKSNLNGSRSLPPHPNCQCNTSTAGHYSVSTTTQQPYLRQNCCENKRIHLEILTHDMVMHGASVSRVRTGNTRFSLLGLCGGGRNCRFQYGGGVGNFLTVL